MRRQRRLMNEINVVPYIDVMLVLLVIFMVTAPMIQHGTVDLPTVAKSSQANTQPLEVVMKLKTATSCAESWSDVALSIVNRSGDSAERVVSRSQLGRLVSEIQSKNPGQQVVIAADKNIRYGLVMDVMDELQRAQVQRIGLLVQSGK